MKHRDPESIENILGEEYEQWLDENYTHLEIEDGEYMSFEKWFDNKKMEFEESLA